MTDIYDLIIIGGGPAGLSASIYANRAGYNTLLLEKIGLGGQMIITDVIDNYPGFSKGISGYELHLKMVEHANRYGLKTESAEVKKIIKNKDKFEIITENKSYYAISVIIATGAKHRELNVPGEKEFISKGVSFCATCDGPFFKNRDIIVIGGGDTAVMEAAFLAKFGKTVKIVHRKDRFRAVKALVDQTDKLPNVSYIFNTVLKEIKGKEKVEYAVLQNLLTNEIKEEKVDGIFILVGILPNTDFLDKELLDQNGYIVTDSHMKSKIDGLYAAGDVRSDTFRQVICAAADGARAAESAGKYIDEIKGLAYK